MIYDIEFSQEANNDMRSVFLWIAEEKGMPQTAMNFDSPQVNVLKFLYISKPFVTFVA